MINLFIRTGDRTHITACLNVERAQETALSLQAVAEGVLTEEGGVALAVGIAPHRGLRSIKQLIAARDKSLDAELARKRKLPGHNVRVLERKKA